jgi:hypothetical protein
MLAEVAKQLNETKLEGGWLWPPVGAIGHPGGGTKKSPANPAETAVSDAMVILLRDRLVSEADLQSKDEDKGKS